MARTLQYWEAALPEPFTVLGLKLRPFSLGHYFILKRFDCAFVSDDVADAGRPDLILAVLVCSMKPSDFVEFVEQRKGGWVPALRELRYADLRGAWDALWRRSFWQEIALWASKVGEFDFSEKAKLFQEYITSQTEQPAYWVEREDESKTGGHWSHSLLHVLMSDCGYSFEQAWNAPISQCLQDFFKHVESSGGVRLMTPDELKDINGVQA